MLSNYISAMSSGKTTKSVAISNTIVANTNNVKSDNVYAESELLRLVIERISREH